MNEQDLQSIVAKVMSEIAGTTSNIQTAPAHHGSSVALPIVNVGKGVFENMEDAIAAAKEAQRKLRMMPMNSESKSSQGFVKKFMKMQIPWHKWVLQRPAWDV